jgi:site-specific recombinase
MNFDDDLLELGCRVTLLMDIYEKDEKKKRDLISLMAILSAITIKNNAQQKELFKDVLRKTLEHINESANHQA